MDGQSILFGVLSVGGGLLSYRYAYRLTKLGEQFDSIGSQTRWHEVEPTDWNVLLTKLFGLFFVAMGLYYAVGPYLAS
ncbi:hypothetical protein [Haloferax larsenii]|uniref:DUF6199 domain-containing protein n=1 Tax=Haloferax larsenii TaxID=302484 RepID=A0A1H7U1B5_HALLR|nr:hypothetical protein [Haloferax larsenii]SEL90569.1 hypothetical protein SAMN04488691_11119 [Haloferax larsenii]